eukprot:TRINITY_DN75772_c0_g1_i1.p1 TRINITY_DN75772_c0_g1~~TRINITY_DN75772_c0_g1_i1.p1  ORF type:complete len:330 (-),score=73.66 TRINITY_DN75772_c0_g1_i1:26-892(-)
MAIIDASVALPSAGPIWDTCLDALRLRPSSGKEFQFYKPSSRPSALLVFCHPSEDSSLCRELSAIWEEELKKAGIEYTSLDLCKEPYLGVSSAAELRDALGKPGGHSMEEVKRLQGLVEESRFLIFIHPIFWFEVPAQLKGFLESVLSSGFAFRKLPSCWTLNRAVHLLEKLPVVPGLLRRYSAYGFLRDKEVYITRTQGGPSAGLGIFGHGSTSLESSMQFCGAHISAVDTIAEVDDISRQAMMEVELPKIRRTIAAHCSEIAIPRGPRFAFFNTRGPASRYKTGAA